MGWFIYVSMLGLRRLWKLVSGNWAGVKLVGEACHVEVDFSGFPVLADLDGQSGDEAQEGGSVGEKAGDAGAALEFLVDAFDGVGGAQAGLVGRGQDEDGQPLGQVFLHPRGQFGGAFGIAEMDGRGFPRLCRPVPIAARVRAGATVTSSASVSLAP